MAHPDIDFRGEASKELFLVFDLKSRSSVFTRWTCLDIPAKGVSGQLHAVANTEDGNVEIEEFWVALRRVGIVDARRSARKDDSDRFAGENFLDRYVVSDDFAVDVLVADPSCDKLCELGAEVEDEYSFGLERIDRFGHAKSGVRSPC